MATTRRKFTAEFKTKVVIEALKERSTMAELAKKYELSAVVISKWKSDFLGKASSVFTTENASNEKEDGQTDALYAQIGKLKVENEFLKKSCAKLGL